MPTFKPRNTARARELRRMATPAERLLWQYLSRSRLGAKFSRQMPVGPWFADFLCRELRLVVEVDGVSHDLQLAHDARRDAWLQANGYVVVRVSNADVLGNVEGVVRHLQEVVEGLRSGQAQAHPQPLPQAGGE